MKNVLWLKFSNECVSTIVYYGFSKNREIRQNNKLIFKMSLKFTMQARHRF